MKVVKRESRRTFVVAGGKRGIRGQQIFLIFRADLPEVDVYGGVGRVKPTFSILLQ